MKKETLINNRSFILRSQSGKVEDVSIQEIKNTTTYSGGGMVINGTGFIAPPKVVTRNNTITKFYLKMKKQEVPVKFQNYDVSLRNGHKVTLLWGGLKNAEKYYLLGLINHDTALKYNFINSNTTELLKLHSGKIKISCLIGFLILIIPFGIVFLLINFIRNFSINNKAEKAQKQLIEEINQIIKEYQNEFIEKAENVN